MLQPTKHQFKYQLGQKVRLPTETEDGKPYVDEGFVIGQCVTIPGAIVSGNWYLIEWTSLPEDQHLSTGYIDWAHEAELTHG